MAIRLNNGTEIQKSLEREARLNTADGEIINTINTNIQPCLIVNPMWNARNSFITQWNTSTTGSSSKTLDSNKTFFVTEAALTMVHDAAYNGGSVVITGEDDHGNSRILVKTFNTTGASKDYYVQRTFPVPIKLKKGSDINFVRSFTAGTASFSFLVSGYYIPDN